MGECSGSAGIQCRLPKSTSPAVTSHMAAQVGQHAIAYGGAGWACQGYSTASCGPVGKQAMKKKQSHMVVSDLFGFQTKTRKVHTVKQCFDKAFKQLLKAFKTPCKQFLKEQHWDVCEHQADNSAWSNDRSSCREAQKACPSKALRTM